MNATLIECPDCKTNFKIKYYNQIFCNIKCRNNFNTKLYYKTHKKQCPKCNELIRITSKRCKKCANENRYQKDMTLSDYQRNSKKDHPSWRNTDIRNFARSWNKNLRKLPCQNCGYNKHIELAHKKSINSFALNSTLGEINHPNNLLVLCPNCHWEFDNNILLLKDIKSREMVQPVEVAST